ncbi:hypothetical protein BD311DRAFT_716535 [Dichomitus squalens]|uniref:Transmembrane protein n=1 Tax=Dichomitus squalens TaxID=114155 RepID=A0A4Q9MU15_9APHY|nr:hypothetical protein BD311DRAFT_863310 [Dichomitus squalens]TBU31351.1 hypothetical protein BD311DRAFT_716535 [Dichomitus squalens]
MSSPAASSSTSHLTFFGVFGRPAAPTHDIDVEAQLPPPRPARTNTPRTIRVSVHEETATNAIDDFFGASRSSNTSPTGTRDSRHDESRLSVSLEDVPPPYEHSESMEPPMYTAVADQPTLAMYLFKFGFLFPLFWVAGALILLSPLSAPPDWELTKSTIEREELILSMRRTEVKWARRCAAALSVFVVVALALVLGVVLGMRS